MSRLDKLNTEERFPVTECGYTAGKYLMALNVKYI